MPRTAIAVLGSVGLIVGSFTLAGCADTAPSAALAADHARDGVIESLRAGVHRGRTAIEAIHRSWFAVCPDLRLTLEARLVEDDRAAVF